MEKGLGTIGSQPLELHLPGVWLSRKEKGEVADPLALEWSEDTSVLTAYAHSVCCPYAPGLREHGDRLGLPVGYECMSVFVPESYKLFPLLPVYITM